MSHRSSTSEDDENLFIVNYSPCLKRRASSVTRDSRTRPANSLTCWEINTVDKSTLKWIMLVEPCAHCDNYKNDFMQFSPAKKKKKQEEIGSKYHCETYWRQKGVRDIAGLSTDNATILYDEANVDDDLKAKSADCQKGAAAMAVTTATRNPRPVSNSDLLLALRGQEKAFEKQKLEVINPLEVKVEVLHNELTSMHQENLQQAQLIAEQVQQLESLCKCNPPPMQLLSESDSLKAQVKKLSKELEKLKSDKVIIEELFSSSTSTKKAIQLLFRRRHPNKWQSSMAKELAACIIDNELFSGEAYDRVADRLVARLKKGHPLKDPFELAKAMDTAGAVLNLSALNILQKCATQMATVAG